MIDIVMGQAQLNADLKRGWLGHLWIRSTKGFTAGRYKTILFEYTECLQQWKEILLAKQFIDKKLQYILFFNNGTNGQVPRFKTIILYQA